jgi:hypothetical protein
MPPDICFRQQQLLRAAPTIYMWMGETLKDEISE